MKRVLYRVVSLNLNSAMRPRLFFTSMMLFVACVVRAQDVVYSPPQKVNTGISKVEIIGRTDQGILVRHTQRDDDEIVSFYDNMQQHWRKKIPIHDKNAALLQIVPDVDSLTFFYTLTLKGVTTLHGFRTSTRAEPPVKIFTCDTLTRNFLSPAVQPQFTFTADKRYILYWFPDPNFENNHILHVQCLNEKLKGVWTRNMRIEGFDHPEVVAGVIDSAANATIVCGNFKDRSVKNDFPYVALLVASIRDAGTKIHQQVIRNEDVLYSSGLAKGDAFTGDVIVGGLYAHAIGVESSGFYLLKYSAADDSVTTINYQAHTTEFLAQLTGSPTPKKNDGFFDFNVTELIVKRDGGAVLLAESQSVSSEAFTTPGLGGFGFSNGFVVNSYHYDDIAAISFKPDGQTEWKTILHKKQATEGDGGFYSSFATVIARNQAYLLYNDDVNGQSVVAYYSLDASGKQSRSEMFNAERKGVMLAMREAKQISNNEIVIPSLKRNYLQFIKITY